MATSMYVPPSLDDVEAAMDDPRRPLLADRMASAPADDGQASPRPAAGGQQQAGSTAAPVTSSNGGGAPAGITATIHHIPTVAQGRPVLPGYAGHGSIATGIAVSGDGALMLDAPDAQLYWAAQRPLLISWLVSSVLSLAFFFPFYLGTGLFITGEIAACLGIAGSAIHVCSACGSGLDARNQIRITHSMAGAAAALDIFTVFLAVLVLLGVECGGGGGEGSAQASGDVCNYLVVYVLMFACYTALHSSLSLRVSQAAKNVQRLASPVSSGMVSLA